MAGSDFSQLQAAIDSLTVQVGSTETVEGSAEAAFAGFSVQILKRAGDPQAPQFAGGPAGSSGGEGSGCRVPVVQGEHRQVPVHQTAVQTDRPREACASCEAGLRGAGSRDGREGKVTNIEIADS